MTTWTPVASPVDDETWSTVSGTRQSPATFVYDDFAYGAPGDSVASRVGPFGTGWNIYKQFSTSSIPYVSGVSSAIANYNGLTPPSFAIAAGTDDAYPEYRLDATFRWLSHATYAYAWALGIHTDADGSVRPYELTFLGGETGTPHELELSYPGTSVTSNIASQPQIGTDYVATLIASNTSSGVSITGTFLGSTLTLFRAGETLDSAGSTTFELIDAVSPAPISTSTQGLHLRKFVVRSINTLDPWTTVAAP